MSIRDGWTRVVPGVYAKSHFRIHRGDAGWYWSDVVQILPYFRGPTSTLREAKIAAEAAMLCLKQATSTNGGEHHE